MHHLTFDQDLSSKEFSEKLNLLVKKGINFNQKSKLGNTAAHIVANRCTFHRTNISHFPLFVGLAKQNKFDFNSKGEEGLTVLQIASSLQYKNYRFFDPISNVQTLIEAVANLDLDCTSASGATAFFYAIQACRVDEAMILLNAGADPLCYGNKESNPLTLIESYLADNRYGAIHVELFELKQMIIDMRTRLFR
ncbi:MAG: ankyrin repeat domain-containing protein, partial [Tatlockia sp.]|nr:ankyrin repeat domain-containing protein [Tatlockia sp.]